LDKPNLFLGLAFIKNLSQWSKKQLQRMKNKEAGEASLTAHAKPAGLQDSLFREGGLSVPAFLKIFRNGLKSNYNA
jgi:hypothetical protein